MRFIYTRAFTVGFTIFLSVALLVILDSKGYLGALKDGFNRTYGYSSLNLARVADNAKSFFQTVFTIKDLVKTNAVLNQKINELSFENARLQASSAENAALRNALNFKQQTKLNLLPTEVIGNDPTGFTQVIAIDKGSEQGVKLRAPIVVAPGLLVGKVTKVNPSSAEVTLITDPSIVVNGEVSDSGARGLVRGEHGLGLSFDLISQNDIIKTQDLVVTSGLSGDFPQGILIGQIDSIKSSGSSDLFQNAFIAPAADLRNLRFLFVVQQ